MYNSDNLMVVINSFINSPLSLLVSSTASLSNTLFYIWCWARKVIIAVSPLCLLIHKDFKDKAYMLRQSPFEMADGFMLKYFPEGEIARAGASSRFTTAAKQRDAIIEYIESFKTFRCYEPIDVNNLINIVYPDCNLFYAKAGSAYIEATSSVFWTWYDTGVYTGPKGTSFFFLIGVTILGWLIAAAGNNQYWLAVIWKHLVPARHDADWLDWLKWQIQHPFNCDNLATKWNELIQNADVSSYYTDLIYIYKYMDAVIYCGDGDYRNKMPFMNTWAYEHTDELLKQIQRNDVFPWPERSKRATYELIYGADVTVTPWYLYLIGAVVVLLVAFLIYRFLKNRKKN